MIAVCNNHRKSGVCYAVRKHTAGGARLDADADADAAHIAAARTTDIICDEEAIAATI